VQFAEEVMKMDPPPGGERQAGKKWSRIKLFPARYVPRRTAPAACLSWTQLLAQSVQASDE
jgi:hypothetical protein